MTWSEFTQKEKTAVLKSLIHVANVNGRIGYSAQLYLQMQVLKMNGGNSLIDNATSLSQSEMIAIITNMNIEKKDVVASLWLEAASKINGDSFGMYCINDFNDGKNGHYQYGGELQGKHKQLSLYQTHDFTIDVLIGTIIKRYTLWDSFLT